MTVEKDWYEQTQHAAEARNGFSDQFRGVPGVFSISLVRSPETFGGHNGLQIHVQTDREDMGNVLPSRFDDVPVSLGKKPADKGKAACSNVETNKTIQAAEIVACKETGYYGTVCCPVHYNNSMDLLHCAHVFWNDCNDTASDIEGRTAEVQDFNGNSTDIGTVEYADTNGDFIRIEPYSDVDPQDVIDDDDIYPTIRGNVTKATLDRWVSDSKSNRPMLNNMGVNTGKTNGRVASVNYEESLTCTNFDGGHGVYTWCDFGEGDSGGPTYWYDGNYAWIVNITTDYYWAHDSGCNGGQIGADSCGTGAYKIYDYGYAFGDDLGT